MPRRRAMPTDVASRKKTTGHKNERYFAALIGGDAGRLPHTGKTDVRDEHGRTYSVKGGTWWQIFLYRRSRFETNTVFRGDAIGRVPELMVACLDAFPDEFQDYRANQELYKLGLQTPMRHLRDELVKPRLLRAFLEKSLFNGSEVDYFVILPEDLTDGPDAGKKFHVFARADVVRVLGENLEVTNSRARRADQFDAQKVLFRYHRKNCGEFEVRADRENHYREAKFRLNGPTVLRILTQAVKSPVEISGQIIAYGDGVKAFNIAGR